MILHKAVINVLLNSHLMHNKAFANHQAIVLQSIYTSNNETTAKNKRLKIHAKEPAILGQ